MNRYALFTGPVVLLSFALKNWWVERPDHVVLCLGLTVANLLMIGTVGAFSLIRRRRTPSR
jgi:hypothetical protein